MPYFSSRGLAGVIGAACITLAACAPAPVSDSPPDDDRGFIPGGSYLLVGMDGSAVPLRNVTLLVEENRLSGNGPCNSYSADNSAELPQVQLSPVISGKMACKALDMKLESRYFSVLQAATSMEYYGGVLKVKAPSTWLIFERGVRADSTVSALDAARAGQ